MKSGTLGKVLSPAKFHFLLYQMEVIIIIMVIIIDSWRWKDWVSPT